MIQRPQKAFTLLELIIVIIIVGVLSSLVIPRLTMMIERSRAAEALNMLSVLRRDTEMCLMQNPTSNGSECMKTLATQSNAHFDVWVGGIGWPHTPSQQITLRALRNTNELNVPDSGGSWSCGAANSSAIRSEIVLCVTPTGTQIVGSGLYRNIKF